MINTFLEIFNQISFAAERNVYFILILFIYLLLHLLLARFLNKPLHQKFKSKILENLTLKSKRRFKGLKFIFIYLFMLLLVFSLLDPRWGQKEKTVKEKNIDIVFLLDVSQSMLAEDIKPSRLENAKLQILQFLKLLENDRVAILAFAGASKIICPLTTDYLAIELLLNEATTSLIQVQGTDLKSAFETALDTFDNKIKNHKAIVLITDGENHQSDALSTVKRIKEQGIQIYAIGVGNPNGEIIPIRDQNGQLVDYLKDNQGKVVVTKLNENILKDISQMTEGKYHYAEYGRLQLRKIFLELNKIEKLDRGEKKIIDLEAKYYYSVFGMLICLLLSTTFWLWGRASTKL